MEEVEKMMLQGRRKRKEEEAREEQGRERKR